MEGEDDDSKLKDPKSVSSKVLEYYQKFSQSNELPKYFCGSSESFKNDLKIFPRTKRDESCVEESVVEVVCPVSPASSVASNRKLEWDNGADIGYSNVTTNLILQKSISLPVLNTLEYEKLQKTLLRLSPEGNDTDETPQVPPQQSSSTTSESVPSKHEYIVSTSSSGQKEPPLPPSSSSSASTSKSFVLKDFMKKIGLPIAESTPYSNLETITSLETPRMTSRPTRNPRTIISSPSKSSSCENVSLPRSDNLKVTKPVVVDCGIKTSENKLIQTSLPKNSSIALQTELLPSLDYAAVYPQRSSDENSDAESKCTSFEYHSGTDYVEVPEPEKVESKPNSSKSSQSSTEIPLAELLAINRSDHDVINLQRNLELMQKLIKSKKYSNVTKKHYLKKIAKKMIDNSGTWMKSDSKVEQQDVPSEQEEEIKDGQECGHCLQPRYQSGNNLKDDNESSLENVSKLSEAECAHSLKILPSKNDLPAVAVKSSENLQTETLISPENNTKADGSRLRRNPLFTLASPIDPELEEDKGARGDSNTSVETSDTVTLSSSSSETRTKNWREDTTRSEQLREQKRVPSGEHLLHYANKEREHQLGWIRNEISHLSKLKKLLEVKDAKKKDARRTALQKVLQQPIVEDMKGIKKATTVYVLTTEKNGNSSNYPCGCCRITCVPKSQIGNVTGNVPNLELKKCTCSVTKNASPAKRSPSLVGHNVNVDSNLNDLQSLRMVSNECFTTQKNSNNGRTTVRRYTFELPIEPSSSKSTEFGSLESKSGRSSRYSKPSGEDTNEEPSISLNSDPPKNCRDKSPCKKCCILKRAPQLGCQLVISDEVSVRPESRSPTNSKPKKCLCCECKKRQLSQEFVSANEVKPVAPSRGANQICTCCACKSMKSSVSPRNGRLSKQMFPNEEIVIRHRSRSPPQKCVCGKATNLAAELVSSEEYVIAVRPGQSKGDKDGQLKDDKESQTCLCCVCKKSDFNKIQHLTNELVSSEEIVDKSLNSGNKNKICMCTVQGDDKECQTCACCVCETSQTNKKPELRGELVSAQDIVEPNNPKKNKPSQTSEELNKKKNLSGELVLSEQIVNGNRSISPKRNKICSCRFAGEDKENQTCTCCECVSSSGATQTLDTVVGEEAIQTLDERRESKSQDTQTLLKERSLEASLLNNQEILVRSQRSLQEEEMKRKLLESGSSPKGEETKTAKAGESDSLKSTTTSRTSSSTTTTTQSMLCQCCKQSNGRPPPVIINQEKIYLCRPCSSQTGGADYCGPKPNFMYPGHVCRCTTQNDTVRKIRETIRELENLEFEEEYCKCMLNSNSRSKNDHCARCKCKIKSKYNAKKGGLAYLLTLESDDKLDVDENGEEPHELKEIKIKIPSRRHRKSRDHREKGRDESPEGGRKEKRSSESKNHEKKRRHSKRESRHPSLQEYLCTNKPEFVCSAEERRKCLVELAYMREERCQKYKQLLALSDGIPPEGSGYQRPSLFSHGEMIRTTTKKYNKLPEVQKKVSDRKEQQVKKANKLLANIFNQKLRQQVLRGVHTLPTSASVIKF